MKAAIKWVILLAIMMTIVGGLLFVSAVAISCWVTGGSIKVNGDCSHNFWLENLF